MIHGTHDVTGSRQEDIFTFISAATEKLERQVIPLEYNRIQNTCRTAEEWFCYKHCRSKSATKLNLLLQIIHTSLSDPLELCLLAQMCLVRLMLLSVGAYLILLASTERRSVFYVAWLCIKA